MQTLHLRTSQRSEIIDITSQVRDYLKDLHAHSGIVVIASPHTTAAITVNENADPDVKKDLLNQLDRTIPQNSLFAHVEGNSDAHIKGTLVNFSQVFIVENGQLMLGTWQGIYFVEFDGPRQREVWMKFVGEGKK